MEKEITTLEEARHEAWRLAYIGLAAQGWKQSMRVQLNPFGMEKSLCVYNGPDGVKCAFGHLCIEPPEEETLADTHLSVGTAKLVPHLAKWTSQVRDEQNTNFDWNKFQRFALLLQETHDGYASTMKEEFDNIGRLNGWPLPA